MQEFVVARLIYGVIDGAGSILPFGRFIWLGYTYVVCTFNSPCVESFAHCVLLRKRVCHD